MLSNYYSVGKQSLQFKKYISNTYINGTPHPCQKGVGENGVITEFHENASFEYMIKLDDGREFRAHRGDLQHIDTYPVAEAIRHFDQIVLECVKNDWTVDDIERLLSILKKD